MEPLERQVNMHGNKSIEGPIPPKLIQDESEYDMVMAEFTALVTKHENRTPEETARVRELIPLIKEYEERNFHFDEPDAVDMILHRMDQMGLKRKDLIPMIGSRARFRSPQSQTPTHDSYDGQTPPRLEDAL